MGEFPVCWPISPMCLLLKQMCCVKVPGNGTWLNIILLFSPSFLPLLLLQVCRINNNPFKARKCTVWFIDYPGKLLICVSWVGLARLLSPSHTMSAVPSNCCWSCDSDFLLIRIVTPLNKLEFAFTTAWLANDNTQRASKKSYNLM